MADDCVFCSIVDGTAPAERVYENDFVVAIMDIHPAAPVAAWQSVFHFHLHLVPRQANDRLVRPGHSTSSEQKLPACMPSLTGFSP
jgi:diadenosine tetraphosphate (Ap4A) HIT family hydrolase